MSMDAKAVKAVQEIIDQRIRSDGANRASTHMAEVVEVDKQGTVWVHIFGGAERTPATKALAHVEKGDLVTATIEDGSVTVMGSPSSPAASEKQVMQAASEIAVQIDGVKDGILQVERVVADKVSTSELEAEKARIDAIEADYITSAVLEADYIDADAIEATYMHANMSNSDVAWIQNGTIKNGAITSAMINDVSANKLTAGTINGSVINVTNLNADNITVGTINGQRIGTGSLSLDKLSDDVYTESEVDAKLDTMQAEIDGAIETWTGTEVPTLNNAPASSWTTSGDRDKHVGDVYFNTTSGYNYRFTKSGNTYSWLQIKDTDITNALSRIQIAEGKITTFDSDISTLKTDTGSLTTRTTSLETRADDVDEALLDKVDVTTFNEVSDTVDSHSQTISQHTTAIQNKADSSTVTAVTNRVSKNEQDISGINTTIGQLQTTVESKADGSTVETVSNKLNTVSDTVDGHTQTLTSVTSTQTTIQQTAVKSTVQLWFTKANTTAPNKPTAHVTNNNATGSNSYNQWNLSVPTYNASYPNYYYCYEYQYLDGSYSWSAVTRDIATGESQATSRTAASDASSAVSTANTASTNASNAVSTANTANTNASNAVSTANTANTNASNAVSTANTASTNASNAVSTANTAKSTADTAKSTADTAKSTADKNMRTSQQLWFTKANSTAPSAPSSKVTSTATTGNAWTTKVPVYSSSYPYYFYCMQYIAADGTVTWSDVVYDQATTEAQSVARTTSANLSTLQSDYATFKQTTTEFESTVGSTYATKTELGNIKVGGRNHVLNSGGVLANNRGSAAGSRKEYIALNLGQSYMDVPEGTQVTVSFDIVMDVATANPTLMVYNSNNDGPKCFSSEAGHGESGGPYIRFTAAAGSTISERVSCVGYIRDRDNPPKSTNWLEFYSNYGSSNFFSIANLKLEVGNKATDWTPAPEDMATNAQVSAIESRVSTNETSIQQTNQAVALKANSSDVYTKSATDGLISTEVTNRNAAITAASNAINLSVSQNYTTKTEFDNLEIGGRNLLVKSDWYTSGNYAHNRMAKSGPAEDQTARSGCSFRFTVSDASSNLKHVYLANMKSRGGMVDGEEYVASWWVRASKDADVHPNGYVECFQGQYVRVENPTITTKWQRCSTRFVFNASGNYQAWYLFYPNALEGFTTSDYIEVCDLKLERGNRATDWTPAPEDIDTRVTAAEAAITVNANNITSKVSQTDYTGATVASLINQSADSVKIQANHVVIDGTATFNAIKSSADAVYDAKGAAATAKSEAIGEAASDATSKANAAQAAATNAAKSYTNTVANEITSRGEQLITNGSGTLGNNTNFSAWTYDPSVAMNGSAGSFTIPKEKVYRLPVTDEFLPVSTSEQYLLSFDMMSETEDTKLPVVYAYVNTFDIDKNPIVFVNVHYPEGTMTTLAQDLESGDTEVYLSNVDSSFVYASNRRGLTFWNYTNSKGYTYPPGTYSRNCYNRLFSSQSQIDTANNKITLDSAWTGPTYAAGTSVSMCQDGLTYIYVAASNVRVPATPTHYEGTIGPGLVPGNAGETLPMKFREGTAYAKIGFLWNYGAESNAQIWLANLNFRIYNATHSEVASAQSAADSAAAEEQYIYISRAVGSAAVGKSTTWVSNDSGNQNTWTTKRPQYSSDYPVLYVAKQSQTVAQKASGTTCSCTTPHIDDTTTIIDGGNIITNSITANKLDVSDINASSSLTVGAFTSTTQAGFEDAAKRTYVSIRATAISFTADTATLEATLYVDGVAKTSGVTYAWLKDGTAMSGETARTLSVTTAKGGLEHAYSCTATY